MDSFIGEEAVNPDEKSWSFTSKALLFSNALVSLLIVIVLIYMYMSAGVINDVDPDSLEVSEGVDVGDSKDAANSGSVDDVQDAPDIEADNDPSILRDAPNIEANVGTKLDGEFNSENPLGDDIDSSVLAIVEGCLTQQVTGEQCDNTFTREDITNYCDELESLGDKCFVMGALMNSKEEYCEFIADQTLKERCLAAVSG